MAIEAVGRKDMYTHDEVQQAVAMAQTQQTVDRLQESYVELSRSVASMNSMLALEFRGLRETLATVPTQLSQQIIDCRNQMRKEIENDFPDKLEASEMREHIEKQIATTDKTLGTQISAVDKKIDATDNKLSQQITALQVKVEKLWIKVTVAISTVAAVGYFIQWLFTVGKTVSGG